MNQQIIQLTSANRTKLVRRGQRLEYITIGYNSLEGLVAIAAGLIAGSIALVGFGFDSIIEVTSGAALLWRLQADTAQIAARSFIVNEVKAPSRAVCYVSA